MALSSITHVVGELGVAEARAMGLRPAILKRAFEGKLVAQDPNDELANVLLERIRANHLQELRGSREPGARPRKKSRRVRHPTEV